MSIQAVYHGLFFLDQRLSQVAGSLVATSQGLVRAGNSARGCILGIGGVQ